MSELGERSVSQLAALLPHPDANTNKYERGAVLVAGGSAAYPAAPILAAQAASRCGAGYVRLAVPEDAAAVARQHVLSIVVSGCAQENGSLCAEAVGQVVRYGAKSRCFAVGPGMGTSHDALEFLERLLGSTGKPLVLDADALNLIAEHPAVMESRRACVNVMTPHDGEAARLLGRPLDSRLDGAREIARRFDALVVLKGPQTIMVDPQGNGCMCSSAGPELAKAGSGDVLCGMIAAFLTQRLQPIDAVSLAVYLHGRAAALAAARMSDISVMPEDVVDFLGSAMLELEGGVV